MMSSFMIDLMPSAIQTKKPCGPARFGPMRDCMRADTRRSTQVMIPATGAMQSEKIARENAGVVGGARRSHVGYRETARRRGVVSDREAHEIERSRALFFARL